MIFETQNKISSPIYKNCDIESLFPKNKKKESFIFKIANKNVKINHYNNCETNTNIT